MSYGIFGLRLAYIWFLLSDEDILAYDPNTKGNYSVSDLSGDGADIFICHPISLGVDTICTFSLFWDGLANGFAGKAVDAFSFSPATTLQTGLVSAAGAEDGSALEEHPDDVPEEEDIAADDANDENDTNLVHDADDISDGQEDKGDAATHVRCRK